MDYNFYNGAIRWQISKSIKDMSSIFVLAVMINEIFTFEKFDVGREKRDIVAAESLTYADRRAFDTVPWR